VEARRTELDARGVVVGGKSLPFYAGAMHYWRVDPLHWKGCLRAMHGLGFTIVETYVPWRVHEPERGQYEWTGAKDLRKFITAAGAAGLAVVIRPGPHCNAELTGFGMPDHVLADPGCQARTSRGTPVWMPSPPRAWPVPSYASAAFRERVGEWYAQVAAQVSPLLAPDGPVVAIGVDNEAQMFFRLGAFDHDYHPDAIAWFREEGYADAPTAWSPDDVARCIAWVRFKDRYLARALGDFATKLDDVGLGGIARFHNLPPGHYGLSDLRGIQRAIGGPVGIDAYTARSGFRELRRRGLALCGNASPIPIAFEVGVGFFPWFPPLDKGDDPDRERDQLLTLLATGARGFNLYMAVERERWFGAAISATGTVEANAQWIGKLIRALDEVDWPALRRAPQIALIDTRADARFGLATNVADPLTPVLAEVLDFGPGGAAELGTDGGAVAARHWQTAIASALELAQVPYDIVSEAATEDELASYRAVIAPTGHRVDRALWSTLKGLADGKKAIVVIGPGTPTRDELDQPLDTPAPRRLGRLKDGSPDDLPGLAADLGALVAGDELALWQVERPQWVRTFAHVGVDGRAAVIFAVNDRDKPAVATVIADGDLRDPFTGERMPCEQGKVAIGLPEHGIRMLIVER
jgi:beta-galactosidase